MTHFGTIWLPIARTAARAFFLWDGEVSAPSPELAIWSTKAFARNFYRQVGHVVASLTGEGVRAETVGPLKDEWAYLF